MPHKLAVITVVYQNYNLLKDFLFSLDSQTNKNFHLYISDLSKHKEKISAHIPLTLINDINKGYAHGVNKGIKQAIKDGCDEFCVINNDTFFQKDFIDKALNSLSIYPKTIIGGKIYYAQGFEYHKDRYKSKDLGHVIWFAGGSIDWNHALTPHRGVDEVDRGQYQKTLEVDFVNGALMLFDKFVIDKLGFWDEGYFLYFEDADFSVRAKRGGIKLLYDPTLMIWHKSSQSTEGTGSKLQQKHQMINQLKFGLRYAPFRTKVHLVKNFLIAKLFK